MTWNINQFENELNSKSCKIHTLYFSYFWTDDKEFTFYRPQHLWHFNQRNASPMVRFKGLVISSKSTNYSLSTFPAFQSQFTHKLAPTPHTVSPHILKLFWLVTLRCWYPQLSILRHLISTSKPFLSLSISSWVLVQQGGEVWVLQLGFCIFLSIST